MGTGQREMEKVMLWSVTGNGSHLQLCFQSASSQYRLISKGAPEILHRSMYSSLPTLPQDLVQLIVMV
jgi:hypothetical protein